MFHRYVSNRYGSTALALSCRRSVKTSHEISKSASNHRRHKSPQWQQQVLKVWLLYWSEIQMLVSWTSVQEQNHPQEHSPKWSSSKHEAEADYHKHVTRIEIMSPSISAHDANDQNEYKQEHSQIDLIMNGVSNIWSSNSAIKHGCPQFAYIEKDPQEVYHQQHKAASGAAMKLLVMLGRAIRSFMYWTRRISTCRWENLNP